MPSEFQLDAEGGGAAGPRVRTFRTATADTTIEASDDVVELDVSELTEDTPGVDDQQFIFVDTATPLTGTYTLELFGSTTPPISANSDQTEFETALAAIPELIPGDTFFTDGVGSHNVYFANALGAQDVPEFIATNIDVDGAVTVSTLQEGSPFIEGTLPLLVTYPAGREIGAEVELSNPKEDASKVRIVLADGVECRGSNDPGTGQLSMSASPRSNGARVIRQTAENEVAIFEVPVFDPSD